MKLQIVTDDRTAIKGYETFLLSDLNILSEEVTDNQCEEILASDTISLFSQENVFDFLGLLINKLRLNGTLTVSGIDPRLFCKGVLNGLIPQPTMNTLILQSKCMLDVDLVKQFFQKNGLQIERSTMSGLNYEITARRK
tara:strand:+ start:62 stop:478 length:417 start_codon:yes stop_codon:yes gene_type:complete